tara:strand:+ start:324 stop:950 length:627 start_codon:yes stop_codon:yes gene_type:complete
MDGNYRWSKKNNIPKYDSYKQGANKLLELTKFAFEKYDISYVSAFALSKHNLKRGSSIIKIIKMVLYEFLELNKNNHNFNILFKGNLNILPKKLINNLKNLENSKFKHNLIIYINYSGKDDILSASKSLNKSTNVNDNIFKKSLKSSSIPDPDMLIRTGGFKRLSDFFLYQVSFTEFFFTNTLWPDLKKSNIKKFIKQFNEIDRKFGS